MAKDEGVFWVHSNRADDRTVIFERDERHPGGEAYIGGTGSVEVFPTPEIQRLMREGLIIKVPEPPKDSRKHPVSTEPVYDTNYANQPGEPIQLGRDFDPELVPESAMADINRQQENIPDEVPVPSGVEIPPATQADKTPVRR